jgi:hypothetical protein
MIRHCRRTVREPSGTTSEYARLPLANATSSDLRLISGPRGHGRGLGLRRGRVGPIGIGESLLFTRTAGWQRSARNLGKTCGVEAAVVEYLGGGGTISEVEFGLRLSRARQVMRQQESGLGGPFSGPAQIAEVAAAPELPEDRGRLLRHSP